VRKKKHVKTQGCVFGPQRVKAKQGNSQDKARYGHSPRQGKAIVKSSQGKERSLSSKDKEKQGHSHSHHHSQVKARPESRQDKVTP